jgi:hypothetical protein
MTPWPCLPKLELQVKGKNIYPDGMLRDFFSLRSGFWEAKDTHDDRDVEISKKIEKGIGSRPSRPFTTKS